MENYFSDMDIKKNNFFTDISNYVSYETASLLTVMKLKVFNPTKIRFFKRKQQFKTLLGKTIEVNQGELVSKNDKNS